MQVYDYVHVVSPNIKWQHAFATRLSMPLNDRGISDYTEYCTLQWFQNWLLARLEIIKLLTVILFTPAITVKSNNQ